MAAGRLKKGSGANAGQFGAYRASLYDHSAGEGYGVSPEHEQGALPPNDGAIGVNASVPVFTGGALTARTREAQLRAQAAEKLLQDQETEAARDVDNAWFDAKSSYAAIALSQQLSTSVHRPPFRSDGSAHVDTPSMRMTFLSCFPVAHPAWQRSNLALRGLRARWMPRRLLGQRQEGRKPPAGERRAAAGAGRAAPCRALGSFRQIGRAATVWSAAAGFFV